MYSSITSLSLPWARRMYSTASRRAPSPPQCWVIQCASSFTSSRPLGTAMANPQLRITGRSMMSSPTKAAWLASSFSCSRIERKTASLLAMPWWTWSSRRARAQSHGLRDALGNKPGLEPAQTGQGNSGAIVGVEAFGFHHGAAGDGVAANVGVLGGLLFRRHRLEAGRSGEEPDLAIGQDAVNVEEQEFDFFCAGFRHSDN